MTFGDKRINVAGGTFVEAYPSRDYDVTAVFSTDGQTAGGGLLFIPGRKGSGQHYHQLYSDVDGTPIGPSLRLPFKNLSVAEPDVCWVAQDEYVVYFENDNSKGQLLALVHVGDVLRKGTAFPVAVLSPALFIGRWRTDRRAGPTCGESIQLTDNRWCVDPRRTICCLCCLPSRYDYRYCDRADCRKSKLVRMTFQVTNCTRIRTHFNGVLAASRE